MSYLLFTLEFPPQKGGVGKYYANLAKYWPDGNFFVLADGQPQQDDAPNILRRKLLFKYIRPRWLLALWQLYRLWGCHSPRTRGCGTLFAKFHSKNKVLHIGFHSPKGTMEPPTNKHVIVGQILPLGIATYFLSKIFKFKYSIILHGLDFSLSLKKSKLTGKILNNAEKIICGNGYTASQVAKFNRHLQDKISTVNPGIETVFIRHPQKIKELKEKYSLNNKIVLFGLGRLVARKGFDKAIEAVAMISEKAPNLVLVIGGSGPEKENLEKKINSLPEEIKKKIILLGGISDKECWAWLELCDIFIMISRQIAGDYEGFGIVYLEAGLAGKPVIAGDSGGVRDAVFNGINGFLVNPENIESISEAILSLYENKSLRNELGAQGQRRVVETLTAKKQAEKIYNIL
ncbi:MAG: glycosyltransferase family 4 protein [Patescibacteria group bacterium]|jgi:phosphatidylinositol alpha-1,6-mannosyltransferase